MAANLKFQPVWTLTLPVPAGTKSGDPVMVGTIAGMAEIDRQTDGNATVNVGGVVTISVKGINGAGNVAVAVGDKLYFTTGDTPPVSAKATGSLYGKAVGVVTSGATTTIDVLLCQA